MNDWNKKQLSEGTEKCKNSILEKLETIKSNVLNKQVKHWAHLGDLNHIDEVLNEIVNFGK